MCIHIKEVWRSKQTLSGWLKEKTKFIQKSRNTKLLRKESGCDSPDMKI